MSSSWGGGTPPPNNNVRARLRAFLATRRGRATAGLGAAVVLLGGGLLAIQVASGSSPAPTTTTTTARPTTTAQPTTTTTAPPTWPLTGMPVADPRVTARPAVAVKIDNVQPDSRPQVGINQADVVYEERVEGSVTRFLAVFHSNDAQPVGPVRSARTSDIGIYKPLGTPLFAWSGANPTFAARVRASGIADVGYETYSRAYYRAGSRKAPHNLMLRSISQFWAPGSHFGATAPKPLFAYRRQGAPPVGGGRIHGVRIVFATGAGSAPVEYRWNGRGWARSQSGTPHVDAGGHQVAPKNVIISFTPYGPTDQGDQFGVPIREAKTVGRGDAWVLTGGHRIIAHWVKSRPEAPTRYLDASGHPILLAPGNTWVALCEPGTATAF